MRSYASFRHLALAVSCAALVTLSACHSGAPAGAGDDAPPDVTVVTLKAKPLTLTQELPGRARAFLVAEVRPQVSGIVKKRLFTEGGFVKQGQPLYELDDSLYRAQYESAMAALNKANAALHVAQLAANRSRELIAARAVSTQDNENAIATEAQAQADVGVARANADSSKVNLEYAHIVAPISGFIGKSNVTQGALVTAEQTDSLASIQQLDPIYIEVNQPSSEGLSLKQSIDAGHLHSDASGTPVKILLENGTTYDQQGKLQFADVTVDPTTGNFLLRTVVPNPKSMILPGMYVRAVISEGTRDKAILVPQVAVTHDPQGNASVMVVGKDNKVEARVLHTSRTVGDQWLVDDGLAAGERVIVEGVQKVAPGQAVHAVEQTADTTAKTADH